MRPETYLRLTYREGGRERPAVDCYGLYRLILGEQLGLWLADYPEAEGRLAQARTIAAETDGSAWRRIAPGEERRYDAVVMSGFVGTGSTLRRAPLHIGCVLEPGLMIDIESGAGVTIRPFRTTLRRQAAPTLVNRVLALVRPEALA